jgi:putative Holliday junction resolvase
LIKQAGRSEVRPTHGDRLKPVLLDGARIGNRGALVGVASGVRAILEDVSGIPQKSRVLAPDRAQAAFKILALDYGRTKIGLALADSEARIAQPYDTMERINRNEDMRRLRELARDLGVRQIVVGLPLRLDGTGGAMADEATRFAQHVHKQIGMPVELVDERLSSWEAERILEEEMGRRLVHEETPHGRRKTAGATDGKYTVDAVAAMVILREYLARTALTEGSR